LSWSGLSLPKGTPAPIVAKLEAAMKEAMASPAIRQRMEGNGFVVPEQGSRHYTDFVRAEKERWTKVIRSAGIKPE
jgi:tripartite-type tricarboxylate transporter receptor subunit TctC